MGAILLLAFVPNQEIGNEEKAKEDQELRKAGKAGGKNKSPILKNGILSQQKHVF